jgi:thiol:disulfide interchange protein DsbD
VQPILPGPLALALWGLLALGAAAMLVQRARSLAAPALAGAPVVGVRPAVAAGQRLGWRQAIAALLGLVGVLQVVGAASGATDPLQPLARFAAQSDIAASPGTPRFQPVRSVDELDAALKSAGRPVMLDFYADWCVSCKEMERFTFSDPAVQKKLAGALLLKADVMANNAQDRELLRRFSLFGPPGTIFFDTRGNEIRPARLIGYQNSGRFLDTLKSAGL